MAKKLILFSGGYDSTYLTYKYLVDTNDDITLVVLCSSFSLTGALAPGEILEIQNTIKQLKTYRDFNVKYHVVDPNKANSWYTEHWYNYAISVFENDIKNGVYDNIVIGTTYEQHDGQYCKNISTPGLYTSMLFMSKREKYNLLAPLITHDIHDNFCRWHTFKYMPIALQDTIISKFPAKNKYDQLIKIFIDRGWTAENVNDWRREKNREYGGGKRDMLPNHWIITHLGIPEIKLTGIADESRKMIIVSSKNKESCIDWYSTIEYTPPVDYSLDRWLLTKEDFSLDN